MTILWELYPYLVILFLLEGIVFVRKDTVLFIQRRWLRSSGLLKPGLRFRDLGILFHSFYSFDTPFIFSIKGFYYRQGRLSRPLPFSPLSAYSFISYQKVNTIEKSDKDLLIDGKVIIRTQSPEMANSLHNRLLKLANLDSVTPENIYEPTLALQSIKARLKEVDNLIQWLSIFEFIFFLLLFVVVPLRIMFFKPIISWDLIYLSFLCFTWICGVLTYMICSQKLYGKIDWMNTLQLTVYPISLCRASIYLSNNALVAYNDLAIASVVLDKKRFLWYARYKIELLKACLELDIPHEMQEVFHYLMNKYEQIVNARGIKTAELNMSYQCSDPSTLYYCPVCLAEYRIPLDTCANCNVKTRLVS